MLRVWLKEYLTDEKVLHNKSDNTLRAYKKDIQQLLDFLDKLNIEIPTIKEKHLKDFLQSLKSDDLSKRSINRKLSSIKGYYKFLYKKNYIKTNPSEKLENSEFKKNLLPIFSVEDILKIRSIAFEKNFSDLRDLLIIELLYSSGIRAAELLNLSEGLFNFDEREFKVVGKSERIVFYSKNAAEVLKRYIDAKQMKFSNDYKKEILFVNSSEGRLSDRSLRRILDRVVKKAGIQKELSPHSLRHSFGAYMVHKGMNLHYLQELMGHSSMESTKLYLDYPKEQVFGEEI